MIVKMIRKILIGMFFCDKFRLLFVETFWLQNLLFKYNFKLILYYKFLKKSSKFSVKSCFSPHAVVDHIKIIILFTDKINRHVYAACHIFHSAFTESRTAKTRLNTSIDLLIDFWLQTHEQRAEVKWEVSWEYQIFLITYDLQP